MPPQTTGASLLHQSYEKLNLTDGNLLPASPEPQAQNRAEWASVGEWLMLANRMGVERVFFVGDDPVILFSRLPAGAAESEVLHTYRRAWSLTRPQCLFLATEEDLRVYALTTPPPRSADPASAPQAIEIVNRAADIADHLSLYHRENVEFGALFESPPYAKRQGRADTQLLHDLRVATNALVDEGLHRHLAHALIERVILIRYLEDREILTPDYFEALASKDKRWLRTFLSGSTSPELGPSSAFVACLQKKALTYLIFDQLSRDFNGDLFVITSEEVKQVKQHHLTLINKLLSGAGLDGEPPLFLWAYDFSVVPVSLISAMYEEFYRAGAQDDVGTHYTPPSLVEYALKETLTPEVLDSAPTVCDPACGSGIFLVEAFRRIVRYETGFTGRPPPQERLRQILLERIVGIDVNPEAVRLAAFSLYLAYLNHQTPRDIREAGSLPKLISSGESATPNGVLIVGDAFAPSLADLGGTTASPQEVWARHASGFDVVVGNPPWDEPKKATIQAGEAWAASRELPVGDRNPSHLFLWRSLSLLKPQGVAALFVGAKALHNSRASSRSFRTHWLQSVQLQSVVNFSPARHLFFEGGRAPFVLLRYQPRLSDQADRALPHFSYRTVIPTYALASTGFLTGASVEQRWVSQESFLRRDYLWKTYAWGNHHDDGLMARLDTEKRLRDFLPSSSKPGYGYQRGQKQPSPRLTSLPSLRTFDPWGPLSDQWFEDPPTGVKRQPSEQLYEGQRLLVTQGIKSGFGPAARLEDEPFSFRHQIYCIPLKGLPRAQAETMLGVVLSALGRYRLFMLSGSWGLWHDSLISRDLLDLPMRMADGHDTISMRISSAVRELQGARYGSTGLVQQRDQGHVDLPDHLQEVLSDLDEAVFDLFELNRAERDLVKDFVRCTLPLVGRATAWRNQPTISVPTSHFGTVDDLVDGDPVPIREYLRAFLSMWNRELGASGEFVWQLVPSLRVPMLGVIFETREAGNAVTNPPVPEEEGWQKAQERLAQALGINRVHSMASNSVLRGVSDTNIVILKRNELRLWTASAGREDAEATILQAMAMGRE